MKNKCKWLLIFGCLLLAFTLAACAGSTADENRGAVAEIEGITVQNGDFSAAIDRAQVGDLFVLGTYEQDNNEKNGKEPIQWRVLDKTDQGVLLLSEYILDYGSFETKAYSVTWDGCTARESLNVFDLKKMFDKDTLKHVKWSYISTPGNPEYGTEGSKDTIDRLFLLSCDEVNKYLANTSYISASATKSAEATAGSKKSGTWWLRTPGDTQKNTMFVDQDGSVNQKGKFVQTYEIGKRPAFWLMKEDQADIFGEEKLTYTAIEDANLGNIVLFGEYDVDDDPSNKEPLEWVVLSKEDDKLLLLSRYVIEKKKFGYGPEWADSELREWLNADFYASSFDHEEQKKIQRMITSDKTDDLIFCLSAEEARYFFVSDSTRVAHITKYLEANKFKDYHSTANWWTRSISKALYSSGGVVIVSATGEVLSTGNDPAAPEKYTVTDVGVRPVICVSLSEPQDEAMNMEIFGIDSNHDLDNEESPVIKVFGPGSGGCAVCNGSGYVKYYYGSSDLQAYLEGYSPYTVGRCPSCN